MIKVFVQCEAGTCEKDRYNEKTLEYLSTIELPLAYPYPYGFIPDTIAKDGDNLDCYVITDNPLKAGTVVECNPVGLLEQIEDGEIDHKILAALPGEEPKMDNALLQELRSFIYGIFSHFEDSSVKVGEIASRETALEIINASQFVPKP